MEHVRRRQKMKKLRAAGAKKIRKICAPQAKKKNEKYARRGRARNAFLLKDL